MKQLFSKFNSSYGDLVFADKNHAISASKKLNKPQNYTLAEYHDRFVITTNKRAKEFSKIDSNFVIINYFLSNGTIKDLNESNNSLSVPNMLIDKNIADALCERDFSTEREKLADEGKALPDGSYPIVNKQDLKNAISTYGLGKNHAKAKAHIIKRAKALGASDLIPENW
jgi:hypothetical protein